MIDVPVIVREALKKSLYRNNYRIEVLRSDGSVDFTIDNNNLKQESCTLEEHMSSEEDFRFGLCEGSAFTFDYFGYENIRGRKIKAFIDCGYEEDGEYKTYPIQIGFFTVNECNKHAEDDSYSVLAYDILAGSNLDKNAVQKIINICKKYSNPRAVPCQYIINQLCGEIIDIPLEYEESGISEPIDEIYQTDWGVFTHAFTINSLLFKSQDESGNVNDEYITYYVPETSVRDKARFCVKFNTKTHKMESPFKISFYPKNVRRKYIEFCTRYAKDDWYEESTGRSAKDVTREFFAAQKLYFSFDNILYDFDDFEESEVFTTEIKYNLLESIEFYVVVAENQIDYCEFFDGLKEDIIVYSQDETVMDTLTFDINHFYNYRDYGNTVSTREFVNAVYELSARFGKASRSEEGFRIIELKNLMPITAPDLKPYEGLQLSDDVEHLLKKDYSEFLVDGYTINSFRKLIIYYMDANNNDEQAVYEVTINADGNIDYIIEDNWLVNWKPKTEAQVQKWAAAMAKKMKNIRWISYDVNAVGLPYLETGDKLEISDNDKTYVSFVMGRRLTGIHGLMDEIQCGNTTVS